MLKCLSVFTLFLGCCLSAATADEGKAKIDKKVWGKLQDGTPIDLYTLTNTQGAMVKVTNYGTLVTEIHVPDRDGKLGDVVLGFDDLDSYLRGHPYFGANVGRVANRIAKGQFTLDSKTYKLAINNKPNTLHGGEKGFDKQVWTGESTVTKEGCVVRFEYLSKDKEEGYPGNLKVICTYTWTNKSELKIEFTATTDKATPVNLAHHSYFNLGGHNSGTILDHELMIDALEYTPTDNTLIPTGKIEPVKGTPYDFTKDTAIGKNIKEIPGNPGGYDLNYVLRKTKGDTQPTLVARVTEKKSGRVMQVFSTEPGVQFYTGNFLDGSKGKGGASYKKHQAFCLEPQHYPDSINQPKFPNTVLRPGETYQQTTIFAFSAMK